MNGNGLFFFFLSFRSTVIVLTEHIAVVRKDGKGKI